MDISDQINTLIGDVPVSEQPSNPTENTIWFKTSTNVTSVKLLSQTTNSGSTGDIIIAFEAIDASIQQIEPLCY